MKKIIFALFATMLFGINACYGTSYNVYINSKPIESLRTKSGEIFVPVRSFFESAGFTVQWFAQSGQVTVYNSELNIVMLPGSPYLTVNEKQYTMDDTPQMRNGKMLMPVTAPITALSADTEFTLDGLYIESEFIESDDGWAYEVLNLVNSERQKKGLRQLIWNSDLAYAAQYRCNDMAKRQYFSHYSPEGLSPFDTLRKLGINFSLAAENIAAGQPDPESVVKAWMQSDSHRENILNPNFREMGAAFSRGGSYGIYWAQEFGNT